MRRVMSIVFLILGIVSTSHVQAEKYEGDGAWAVTEYGEGIVLILSVGIFRENPDEGARPTFMVNYDDKDGCLVSFGLTMLLEDIPKQLNKKESIVMLKSVIEQSDFLADDEVLKRIDTRVQGLDMGNVIYARTIIDSDALAAFMLAKTGAISFRNEDGVIMFDMYGFEETINRIIETRCKWQRS